MSTTDTLTAHEIDELIGELQRRKAALKAPPPPPPPVDSWEKFVQRHGGAAASIGWGSRVWFLDGNVGTPQMWYDIKDPRELIWNRRYVHKLWLDSLAEDAQRLRQIPPDIPPEATGFRWPKRRVDGSWLYGCPPPDTVAQGLAVIERLTAEHTAARAAVEAEEVATRHLARC